MKWNDLIEVTCPDCGAARTIKNHGRGQSVRCRSCSPHFVVGGMNARHRETGTKLHWVWLSLKDRCNNPKNKGYKNYGGRGIKVCVEWQLSYEAFRDWALSHGYREGLLIDRENNDGNYEPANCRWVDRLVSSRNSRKKRAPLEIVGHVRNLAAQGFSQIDLAWAFGLHVSTVSEIVNFKTYRDVA